MIVKRAPLLVSILLVWIILSILAFAGRGRAYKQYSADFGKHPAVSVVMRGIHDHVMPWSEGSSADGMTASSEDEDEEKAEKKAGEKAGEKADSDIEETSADADETLSGDEETTDANGKTEAEESSAKSDGKETADDSSENKEKETKSDSSEDKAEKSGEKEESSGSEKSLIIPETSCSKVVPAKDYGVAEDRYLSPKGSVFNKDTEGLFAPNGIYYSLQEVNNSYFNDALFVGDSRTVGLFDYGGMQSFTSFLARESTTVYDLFDDNEKMQYNAKGKKMSERTLKDLLSKAKFRKIYLSVGVNELGIPDTMDYYKEFRKVVQKINKLQPDAIIYIQGIMHVSESKSKTDHVFNNTAIVQRNQAISTLANGRNIFYIDMNGELCDKNGNLKEDLTGDGIHLKASACSLWYKFLKKNAVVIPE